MCFIFMGRILTFYLMPNFGNIDWLTNSWIFLSNGKKFSITPLFLGLKWSFYYTNDSIIGVIINWAWSTNQMIVLLTSFFFNYSSPKVSAWWFGKLSLFDLVHDLFLQIGHINQTKYKSPLFYPSQCFNYKRHWFYL